LPIHNIKFKFAFEVLSENNTKAIPIAYSMQTATQAVICG